MRKNQKMRLRKRSKTRRRKRENKTKPKQNPQKPMIFWKPREKVFKGQGSHQLFK